MMPRRTIERVLTEQGSAFASLVAPEPPKAAAGNDNQQAQQPVNPVKEGEDQSEQLDQADCQPQAAPAIHVELNDTEPDAPGHTNTADASPSAAPDSAKDNTGDGKCQDAGLMTASDGLST